MRDLRFVASYCRQFTFTRTFCDRRATRRVPIESGPRQTTDDKLGIIEKIKSRKHFEIPVPHSLNCVIQNGEVQIDARYCKGSGGG